MTTHADPGERTPPSRRPIGDAPRTKSPRGSKRARTRGPKIAPLWAKLCVIIGSVVMVITGGVVVGPKLAIAWFTKDIPVLNAIPEELKGTDISGPINFLLLGLDQRNSGPDVEALRSDSIVLAHIPASHDRVFMISIPRDMVVHFPYYPSKINASFAVGAVLPDGKRDPSPEGRARGAAKTMGTLSGLVEGGLKFNGAAIIDFEGFKAVLNALGGVNMCVDEDTYSIRYSPSGMDYGYDLDLGNTFEQAVKRNLSKHYPVGCYHMQPWEALDYSRQRDWLALGDTDYGRQRHQQQLLMAIAKEAMSANTITNFGKVVDLQKAAGDLLTLVFGGNTLEDWVLTFSSLRPSDIVSIKTYGGCCRSINLDGSGRECAPGTEGCASYERYDPDLNELLKSVQDDTVFDFLAAHPNWVTDMTAPSSPAAK